MGTAQVYCDQNAGWQPALRFGDLWFANAGLLCTGLGSADFGLTFFRELRDDQGMGLPEEMLEFGAAQRGIGFERDPVGARSVGSWDDAGALDQILEVFRCHLER